MGAGRYFSGNKAAGARSIGYARVCVLSLCFFFVGMKQYKILFLEVKIIVGHV
jgi:hypothetical protein